MLIREILPFIKENQRNVKVHCAIGKPNKFEPLYSFSKGTFKKWQNEQNNKNFERDFILSLIFYKKGEWLFAGIYKTISVNKKRDRGYEYTTELTDIGKDLIGRLVVLFEKDFRNSYLKLEKHIGNLYISEIFKKQYRLDPFPGFENINVNYNLLKEIITENEQSWKSALSNVKGVYLISDKKTGKLYVGSAYGEDAFWTRWENYIKTGHGGNILLKTILGNSTVEYLENFSFSVLEIMKINTDDSKIIEREVYWKKILLTRAFGYNKN